MSSKLPKRNSPKPVEQERTLLEVSKRELFVGPLPNPDALQKYEEVYPGIAERILKMAEIEQAERHAQKRELIELERKNQRALNFNVRLGLFLAFGSVLVSTGMCAYFAYLGNIEAAADAAKWVIASLAAVFITGRFTQSRQAKEEK